MSCSNPMRAFDTGYLTDNGKPALIIKGREVDFIYKPKSRNAALEKSQKLKDVYSDLLIKKYTEVPCQKCEGCRLDKSKEWMQRCMLEQKLWEHNEMLTLTYDEEHVPQKQGIDLKTGEIKPVKTLDKEDIKKFWKDLRRYWKYHYNEDNIRYYMCGEYGDQRGRPHYHIILFNFNVRDKEKYKPSKTGNQMFHSKIIEKIWGKGHIELNEVNAETIAYVARYIMKKQKGRGAKEFYEAQGKVPEYTSQSNRPGIARGYFEDNKFKMYENDKVYIMCKSGLNVLKPAKYFDKLYDAENTDLMEKIKERRKELAQARQDTQVALSGLSIDKIREYKANALKEKIRKLHRSYEEG